MFCINYELSSKKVLKNYVFGIIFSLFKFNGRFKKQISRIEKKILLIADNQLWTFK